MRYTLTTLGLLAAISMAGRAAAQEPTDSTRSEERRADHDRCECSRFRVHVGPRATIRFPRSLHLRTERLRDRVESRLHRRLERQRWDLEIDRERLQGRLRRLIDDGRVRVRILPQRRYRAI